TSRTSSHVCSSALCRSPSSTLFPYTTLFRSTLIMGTGRPERVENIATTTTSLPLTVWIWETTSISASMYLPILSRKVAPSNICRSEEHTSELQSRFDLVCRLLLEKKKYYSVV